MHQTDDLRQQAIHDQGIPEKVRKFLAQGAPLEMIHLDAYGRWFHEGEPFINQRLARLFHRSLHKTEQGTWYLEIKPYTYPVTVELTDSFIDRIQQRATSTKAHFVGHDPDAWTTIDLSTMYTDGDELLALHHNGRPTRFVERAYKDLLEAVELENDRFVLALQDRRIPLKPLPKGFFEG